MRGDRPLWGQAYYAAKAFTPHARGSTQSVNHQGSSFFVYPACAGIDPKIGMIVSTSARLPRMRGDRPQVKRPTGARSWFTARGIDRDGAKFRARHVYPMRDRPLLAPLGMIFLGLPACGDRPIAMMEDPVYPACGIDPQYSQKHGVLCLPRMRTTFFAFPPRRLCLPRMRGDRPKNFAKAQ